MLSLRPQLRTFVRTLLTPRLNRVNADQPHGLVALFAHWVLAVPQPTGLLIFHCLVSLNIPQMRLLQWPFFQLGRCPYACRRDSPVPRRPHRPRSSGRRLVAWMRQLQWRRGFWLADFNRCRRSRCSPHCLAKGTATIGLDRSSTIFAGGSHLSGCRPTLAPLACFDSGWCAASGHLLFIAMVLPNQGDLAASAATRVAANRSAKREINIGSIHGRLPHATYTQPFAPVCGATL